MSYKKRIKLNCAVAASGCLDNLQVALNATGCFPNADVLDAAAAAGHCHICQWLRDVSPALGPPPQPLHLDHAQSLRRVWGAPLSAAAEAGRRDVCEWLLASGWQPDVDAADAAARCGHKALVAWLASLLPGHGLSQVSLAAAAKGYDLPSLKRLVAARPSSPRASVGSGSAPAAAAGSLTPDWHDKVIWLESLGLPRTQEAYTAAATLAAAAPVTAARRPAADAVGASGEASDRDPSSADLGGGVQGAEGPGLPGEPPVILERLLWLRERGYPMYGDEWVPLAAAGCLEALRQLHALGFMLQPNRCAQAAARAGHVPVVAWLAEALDYEVTRPAHHLMWHAYCSGSVRMMDWLRRRGCAWESDAWNAASENGCEAALEWLAANAEIPDSGGDTNSHFVDTAVRGDIAALRAMCRLGVPWDFGNCLNHCVALGAPVPALRCLVEGGCPFYLRTLRPALACRPLRDKARVARGLRWAFAAAGDTGAADWMDAGFGRVGSATEEEEDEEERWLRLRPKDGSWAGL